MIFREDRICYTNVYSKCICCHYLQFQIHIQEFCSALKKNAIEKAGDLFYTFNRIEESGRAKLQIFQPVKAYKGDIEDGLFYSYYTLEHMLSTVVIHKFEEIEWQYAALMKYAEENNLVISSNFFNTVHTVNNKKYFIIKVRAKQLM